jgi:hypothetical protein
MAIYPAEQAALARKSDFDRPDDYYDGKNLTPEQWQDLCKLKDRNVALYDKRWQAAKEVIDKIAEWVGINDNGRYLYGLVDGETPILDKLEEYLSHRGDKVQLKKRIDELEAENRVLRSLVGK